MELRGQDQDMGMPSYPPQPNQELPSSKLSSAPIISTLADRRREETGRGSTILSPTQNLDHHHLHLHQQQHHHQHQLNLQQQQQTHRQGRESNPNPEPDPAQPASATIAGASNSNTSPPPPKTQLRPQAQPTSSATNGTASIRYRECLKNHAASMGGHVVDGCGEFMPSGEEGTQEALKCAACDCHRNFHRKEIDGESQSRANCYYSYNSNRKSSQRTTIHPPQPPPSLPKLPPQQHQKYPHAFSLGLTTSPTTGLIQPLMMAFGGSSGAPAESSSEDLNMFQSTAEAQPMTQPSFSPSKKRFRTKFSQEQKDRMHEFADKLGGKIQKQDEQQVQQFCNEVGVKKKAFKIWMHNNKQAMKKKQL